MKRVYERARAGEIADFTSISVPYEVPAKPAVVIDTSTTALPQALDQLIQHLEPCLA